MKYLDRLNWAGKGLILGIVLLIMTTLAGKLTGHWGYPLPIFAKILASPSPESPIIFNPLFLVINLLIWLITGILVSGITHRIMRWQNND